MTLSLICLQYSQNFIKEKDNERDLLTQGRMKRENNNNKKDDISRFQMIFVRVRAQNCLSRAK